MEISCECDAPLRTFHAERQRELFMQSNNENRAKTQETNKHMTEEFCPTDFHPRNTPLENALSSTSLYYRGLFTYPGWFTIQSHPSTYSTTVLHPSIRRWFFLKVKFGPKCAQMLTVRIHFLLTLCCILFMRGTEHVIFEQCKLNRAKLHIYNT